jgi:hypothetical protein
MNKNQLLSRVGLVSVSLLLVMALLAIALPQRAMAAVSADSKPDPNAVFTTFLKNNRVYINLAAPKEDVKFRVRVKDASRSMPKWYELGTLLTDRKEAKTGIFPLPAALKKTLYIDVCLKNQSSNRLTCKKIFNPGQ